MSSEDKMNEISKHSSGCCNGYYSTTAATSLNTLCEHKSSQFLQYTNLIDPSPESLLSKDSFNMYIKNQANLSDTENDLLVSVIQKEYEDIRKKTGDKDVLGDSIYKHIFEYHSDSNSCQNSLILGEDTLSKESDKIQLNTQSPQKFPENTNHISKSQEITSYIHQSVINSDIDENCHYWENFPNYLGESNYMTYPSFYNYMNYLSYPFNQPKLINNKKSNLAEYQKTTKSNTTLAYNYSIHSQVQTTKTCIYPLSYNSGNALNVPFKEGIMIQTSHHVSVSSKFLQQKLDNRESITKIDYTNHIKGKILSLISLKDSSKKLQKSINLFTEEVIDLVFHEIFQMIIPNLHLSFCNYFFQKFFKVLSKDQRIQVLKLFKVNNMFSLCCLKIGVYLMVSIIERVNSSEEMQLIDSILSDKLLNLLVHPTGYRVLEKIVLKFDEKYFSQILPTIFSDFVAYCQNSFASEVIKIILSRIHKSSKASKAFATSITENLIELSSNHTSSSVVVASIYNFKESHKQCVFNSSLSILSKLLVHEEAAKIVEKLLIYNAYLTVECVLSLLSNDDTASTYELLCSEVFLRRFHSVYASGTSKQCALLIDILKGLLTKSSLPNMAKWIKVVRDKHLSNSNCFENFYRKKG